MMKYGETFKGRHMTLNTSCSEVNTFSIWPYMLQYPSILQADNKGHNETARMHRLILGFSLCPHIA